MCNGNFGCKTIIFIFFNLQVFYVCNVQTSRTTINISKGCYLQHRVALTASINLPKARHASRWSPRGSSPEAPPKYSHLVPTTVNDNMLLPSLSNPQLRRGTPFHEFAPQIEGRLYRLQSLFTHYSRSTE